MTRARNISRLVSDQVTGNVNISGILTASALFGEGSGITGVTAVGSGVTILDNGLNKGAASKIDFADHFTVTDISSGIATITVGVTTEYITSTQINNSGVTTTATLSVTGQSTLSNVNVSSGILTSGRLTITGQSTLSNLNVSSGITTISGQAIIGNANISGITTTDFLAVDYNATVSAAATFLSDVTITGQSTLSNLNVSSGIATISQAIIGNANISGITTTDFLVVDYNATVSAAATFLSDVTMSGFTTVTNGGINATGIITASSFRGDGSQLTGFGVGNTADVRTSSLVVSGVSTFSGITTITGQTFFTPQLNVSGIATVTELTIGNIGAEILGFTTFTPGGLDVVGVVTAASFIGDASYTASGRWILGASGTNDYTFIGIGFTQTTNDPVLYLARGRVYEFANNSGGAHPFEIRVSNGGAAYNDGVTNNAAAMGVIRFEVPFSAPNTLYYQCTNHAGMGNTITIYPSI
jgi:hypothetical protein